MMFTCLLYFLLFTTIETISSIIKEPNLLDDETAGKTFRNLLIGYDRKLRPNYLGNSTLIKIDLLISGFGAINEKTMSFDVEIFLRQSWYDHRLQHNFTKRLTLPFGRGIPAAYVWVPDTYFVNAVNAKRHMVTTSNERLDIYSDGKIFLGSRLTVRAKCKMDFRNYPMDVQQCSLGMGSFSLNTRHLMYEWDEDPLQAWSAELQQFIIFDIRNESQVHSYEAGNYSECWARFTLKRRMANHIMTIFFPTSALVVVSWISFWFNRNCASARVGLGIIPLLTSCKFWFSVNRQLPRVSYVKAVDFYFIGSFCFIGCALLEYALVMNGEFYKRKKKKSKELRERRNSSLQRRSATSLISLSSASSFLYRPQQNIDIWSLQRIKKAQKPAKKQELIPLKGMDNRGRHIEYHDRHKEKIHTDEIPRQKVNRDEMPYYFKAYPIQGKPTSVDLIARFLFPFCYLCFNIVFWVYYHESHSKFKPDMH